MAGPRGVGEQSLVPPRGSAGTSGQLWGLQSGCRAVLEPRAGVGWAATLLCSEVSKGKMPLWHLSRVFHTPCLSFLTGEMVLARSHSAQLSATVSLGAAHPVPLARPAMAGRRIP